ncbi:pyridoxal-phosphate dependent enzyme [Lentzea sp. HUAS TT2]|uniref:threonine ammonia-lyase n=1 Tax=Lentzea sp. HUAS TT2 TaxID=3447454 RepID=UPI003F71C80D
MGLEILEDLPDVEAVVVPMSGGGLISGVATAIKPRPDVRVIGAEPELAADIAESKRANSRAQTAADALKALGAEVFIVGITERVERANALVAERGAALIPPFDHPDVIAGQGTIGLEILEDLPDVEAVVVPMSGGGLISGVATAIKSLRPDVRVIGAEPELAADIAESLKAGELVRWDPLKRAQTAADALRDEPSALTWAHISKYVDDVITVSEDEILKAVAGLARRARLVAEPSGAVAVAAQAKLGGGVAIVSGGNVDPALLVRLLAT